MTGTSRGISTSNGSLTNPPNSIFFGGDYLTNNLSNIATYTTNNASQTYCAANIN